MEKLAITEWYFILKDENTAWQKDFADKEWENVVVPHDWSVKQDFEKNASSGTGYLPGGIGWYRAHYSISNLALSPTQIVSLEFEGIYKNADVWVNGYHLGYRPSGYSSFSFDISEIIQLAPNDDLVIAIRVDHSDISDSRWYNGSGINRPVKIVIVEDLHIERYGLSFVTQSVEGNVAKIESTISLENVGKDSKSIELTLELRELNGEVAFEFPRTKRTVHPGKKEFIFFEGDFENPVLWSIKNPHLYELVATIYSDDKKSVWSQNVGIRTFEFNCDKGFSLNEEPMKLKGVCLHEDAGCWGTAVPTVVWLRRLVKLKEMGANAIRMAHNPHSAVLYDLCDILGFLVFDEAFDEWENPKNKWWQGHNVYPPKYEGYAKDFPVWHEKDLINMVQRNKNHPSIIAWSIGNEVDYPNDPYQNSLFKEMTGNNDSNKPEEERIYNENRPNTLRLTTIAKELAAIVRSVDSTRPVTLAAAFPELSSHTGLLDDLDVVGYNYKEQFYEEDHRRFPTKPFVGSENGHGYPEWLSVVKNDYIAGQFLWTGIDYLGEARGWPIHGSGAGLLTLAGFEKSNYWLRKNWWTSELNVNVFSTIYDSTNPHPQWQDVYKKWDYPLGTMVEIRIFSNADVVELELNNRKVVVNYNEKYGYFSTIIEYKSGDLVAKAYLEGDCVTDRLCSIGESCQLVANVWNDVISAEKVTSSNVLLEDIYQIELIFNDLNGNRTYDEKKIWFDTNKSTCQFLGFENGDLSDITSYLEANRRSFKGQLMAYVQGKSGDSAVFFSDGFVPLKVIL